MIIEQSEHIICEVGKAFMGKDDIVRKVLMTIYAGGRSSPRSSICTPMPPGTTCAPSTGSCLAS